MRHTHDISLPITHEEEESDETDLEDIDAGEELINRPWKESATAVHHEAVDVHDFVAIDDPENAECQRAEDEHERGDDGVDDRCDTTSVASKGMDNNDTSVCGRWIMYLLMQPITVYIGKKLPQGTG